MGLWSRLKSVYSGITNLRRSAFERPQGHGWWPVGRNVTTVPVDHESALTYSAVWACTRVIAESIMQMRWSVYASMGEDNGRTPLFSHPLSWILSKQANPEMSAAVWRRLELAWGLTWGNGYAEIERGGDGRAIWLWPIEPWRVGIDRTQNGDLVYLIQNKGKSDAVLSPADMYHLRGLGCDGVQGYSVVQMARQSMGLGLALEQGSAQLFGQGLSTPGAFKYPGKLSEPARENLRKSMDERWTGVKNFHRPILLEEGLDWVNMSINPDDAQFLESRRFQVLEICRWFRVPPHKIADLDRATFSNIENQSIEFVTDTLVPWVVLLEQEADLKLFGGNRNNLFTKLNVASLMRGDLQSRYAAYAIGRQWGWLSNNDVRRLEDMNPLPPHLGDTFLSPLNFQTIPLNPAQAPMLPPPPRPDQPQPMNDEDALRAILAARVAAMKNGHAQEGA